MALTPEQTELLGRLLSLGIPLPIALPIAMDPAEAKRGATEGLQLVNQGMDFVLDTVTQPKKTKKKVSAYNRKYKAAFKSVSPKYKLKNGKWKKGGFKAAVRAAHKKAGGKK